MTCTTVWHQPANFFSALQHIDKCSDLVLWSRQVAVLRRRRDTVQRGQPSDLSSTSSAIRPTTKLETASTTTIIKWRQNEKHKGKHKKTTRMNECRFTFMYKSPGGACLLAQAWSKPPQLQRSYGYSSRHVSRMSERWLHETRNAQQLPMSKTFKYSQRLSMS